MDDNKQIHELAQQVAPLIGYHYSVVRNLDPDGTLRHWAVIEKDGEDGKLVGKLSFGLIGYGHMKNRIEIGVAWPQNPTNFGTKTVEHYNRKGRRTDITVSAEKSAEKIAKDIKSRLLADAESLYAEAQKNLDADLAYSARKRAAIEKVAGLLGKTITGREMESDRSPTFYVGKSYNSRVTVHSGTSIKVELDVNDSNIAKVIEFAKSLEA